MKKYITSEMVWNQSELGKLPLENNFRMRGLETTRVDTLIDAGFAFVLSFLAISQENIPTSFTELKTNLSAIPALFLSFLILMMFWTEHRRWSRRYGIENTLSIIVSAGLLFSLLIYIFPLRMLFQSMFESLSSGILAFDFEFQSYDEVRHFFALYALGYLVMSFLTALLYLLAIKKKSTLSLNRYELHNTQGIFQRWVISILFAVLSLVLAYSLPINLLPLSGYILFGLFVVNYIHSKIHNKLGAC